MSDTKDEISANDQLSPDLRGVDAGDLGDWMYLRRRGAIKGDETLILAQDVRKAAQPFIDAAVAAERERCAKLCEQHAAEHWDHEGGALACANRIRGA